MFWKLVTGKYWPMNENEDERVLIIINKQDMIFWIEPAL